MNLKDAIAQALGKNRKDDEGEDFIVFTSGTHARRVRRAQERAHTSRRRKGQRVFNRQQRQIRFERETLAKQLEILEAGAGHPNYSNVLNGLISKYGPQLEAMMEAEKTGIVA